MELTAIILRSTSTVDTSLIGIVRGAECAGVEGGDAFILRGC